MSIEQAVIENLRGMSREAQQQVLHYAQALRREGIAVKPPLKGLHGLWADLPFTVSEDDIVEARKEMWGNFPREIES